jgi:5-carboxymethyl-2-hydroxymuconate isomerase
VPHFVVDCSQSLLSTQSEQEIIVQLHLVAHESKLFTENDIKVRVNPFTTFLVGNQKQDFIHVFSHIMQGRTTEQKAKLSKSFVTKLGEMFPQVTNIAMNVSEFEKATYYNKNMIKEKHE